MSEFIAVFFQFLVMALWLVVLGRVLLSWINPTFQGSVARFLFETTEPLLTPIRRVLPSSGTLDFSPLVLLLILGVLLAGPAPLTRISFAVRVTPRAGRDSVDGVGPSGELLVRVRAAPANGAANEAVRRTISAAAGVPPSHVALVRGDSSRLKRYSVDAADLAAIRETWPELKAGL